MLSKFKLIEQIPPWYTNQKVKPYIEKGDIKFWWDIPEYNGNEDENEERLMRPDGKCGNFDVTWALCLADMKNTPFYPN